MRPSELRRRLTPALALAGALLACKEEPAPDEPPALTDEPRQEDEPAEQSVRVPVAGEDYEEQVAELKKLLLVAERRAPASFIDRREVSAAPEQVAYRLLRTRELGGRAPDTARELKTKIRDIQRARGLPQTGVIDAATAKTLDLPVKERVGEERDTRGETERQVEESRLEQEEESRLEQVEKSRLEQVEESRRRQMEESRLREEAPRVNEQPAGEKEPAEAESTQPAERERDKALEIRRRERLAPAPERALQR